jgi:iron complex transport system permease protein
LSRLLFLAIVAIAVLLVSVAIGAADLPLRAVFDALTGKGDETTRTIVLSLRLPRAVLALLVGGALGLAGAVFQALLRNPLAEPWVLGVSGGAAVGAVAAVVLGWNLAAPWSIPLAALAGALLAILLVLRIATHAARGLDTRVLILAGLVVAAFFNAAIQLLLTFSSGETFRSAVFWMMGSLAAASWTSVTAVTAYLLPAMAALLVMARPLNLLAVGEETASYLGTRVERVKLASYLIASLLVAATVAVSGIIGFVGLIVPHAIRLMWGSDHQLLLPASVLLGGGFLLAADTAARTVAAPAELPLGVITALVGVPLFVVLLTRRAV